MIRTLLGTALAVFGPGLAPAWALDWSDVVTPDTVFPLFGNHPAVRKSLGSRELPPPYGVTANYSTYLQRVTITELKFYELEAGQRIPLPPELLPALASAFEPASGADNSVHLFGARLDVWLLPFLNVFYLGGEGDAEAEVESTVAGSPEPGFMLLPYDPRAHTVGGNLAYGGEHWWVNIAYARTKLRGDGDSGLQFRMTSILQGVRLGYQSDPRWNFWLGAAHLELRSLRGSMQGSNWLTSLKPVRDGVLGQVHRAFDPPDEDATSFAFAARARPTESWSYAVGAAFWPTQRAGLQIEIGADRDGGQQLTAELQLRIP